MRMFFGVGSSVLLASANRQAHLWPQTDPGHGPVVETEHGMVEGTTRANTDGKTTGGPVDGFFGIPYAEPPLKQNRFRAPQPLVSTWHGSTRQAKKLAPTCPQIEIMSKLHFGDEDCLYLNVYRPHSVTAKDLPVMFWIYGGGFFMGDSYNFLGRDGDGLYDGFNVVGRHPQIIVSHNYRLSAFGFMALSELEAESDGTMGNWGMLDQRAAMQWTQRNIKNFGGDPNRVTIAGESAGGCSITWHLVSPGSKGLFHGAILMSGSSGTSEWFFQKKEFAVKFYEDWSGILGCKDPSTRLQCLRELPQERLMVPVAQWVKDWAARFAHLPLPADIPEFASPLFPTAPFAPVIDGTDLALPAMPLDLMESGKFHNVPLLIGGNQDDGAYLGPLMPLLWGAFPFFGMDKNHFFNWMLPDEADREKALQLYSEENGFPVSNAWHKDTMKRLFRDAFCACATRDISTAFSKHGAPVYSYVFGFDYKAKFPLSTLGTPHGFELVFTFRNGANFWGNVRFDGTEYHKMADIMSCHWSSFVTCGAMKCTPAVEQCYDAPDQSVDWPMFNGNTSANRQYMFLETHPSVRNITPTAKYGEDAFPGDDRCDFWRHANMDWQGIRHGLESVGSSSAALV